MIFLYLIIFMAEELVLERVTSKKNVDALIPILLLQLMLSESCIYLFNVRDQKTQERYLLNSRHSNLYCSNCNVK